MHEQYVLIAMIVGVGLLRFMVVSRAEEARRKQLSFLAGGWFNDRLFGFRISRLLVLWVGTCLVVAFLVAWRRLP